MPRTGIKTRGGALGNRGIDILSCDYWFYDTVGKALFFGFWTC